MPFFLPCGRCDAIVLNAALAALGPAIIAVSFWLTVEQVEPFASHFYLLAWYGLIFSVDQLIRRVEGRSLIAACGPSFLLLLFWSAVTWFFFELINLRIQNWYYIFLDDDAVVRLVGTVFAFATVFPGMFWIDHFLFQRGIGVGLRGPAVRVTRSLSYWLQLVGALLMLLALTLPTYFFAGVWLSVILIVAPINYRRNVDGLLRQLGAGSYGPTVRLLLTGLIAGGFWELFNFWARAKWIYTVPFFDELKLFEMPVLGFLGFPPFALECACLYRLLVSCHLAPAFGVFVSTGSRATPPPMISRLVIIAVAIVLSLTSFHFMDRHTVASRIPRVDAVESLDASVRMHLAELDIRYLTQLEGRGSRPVWQTLEQRLGTEEFLQLEQLCGLYLHQGMGVDFGNLMVAAGFRSLEELKSSALKPRAVLGRLAKVAEGRRLPTLAQVRIWIRRLP